MGKSKKLNKAYNDENFSLIGRYKMYLQSHPNRSVFF